MIERVMKAGTAARSAGYRVSYLDRAMTEDSINTLTNRVADWIFGTSNRQKGSREMGDEGSLGHGTRRDVMRICVEAKECDGKRRAILAVVLAVAEKMPVGLLLHRALLENPTIGYANLSEGSC